MMLRVEIAGTTDTVAVRGGPCSNFAAVPASRSFNHL
jgi:hypothetical protein